jgi:hypothetical protein
MIENLLANAGTPLMWATGLHLVVGNLLIGIGEGLLTGLIFRVKIIKAIGLMILANYFSSWSAYMILAFMRPYLDETITIYTIQHAIWLAYGFAFIYTLFTEWPFLFFLLRQKKHKLILSIVATVLIQTVSYAMLAYWYWGNSYNSLFQNAQIVHSSDFINSKKATVYFIGQDKNIYQIDLDGLQTEKIYEPVKKQNLMKLYLKINPDSGNADLCVSLLKDIYSEWEDVVYIVKKDIVTSKQLETVSLYERVNDWSAKATDWRPQNQRQWDIQEGFWAAEGLRFWNTQTQENIYIALETPFVKWLVRNATVLPGDEVVFQFGNQVCIYSFPTQKLTLISMGTSPVTIISDK